MKTKAIQIREALERINEDLLTLSDDIWLNIDHNDPQALEDGFQFKKDFNDRQTEFASAAQGIIDLLENYSGAERIEKEAPGKTRAQRERKIRELDRHNPHTLDEDFAFKRPVGMRLNGEAYTGLHTWKAVYRKVFAYLADRDPKRFDKLDTSDAAVSRRGNPYITREKANLRQAMGVGRGLYAEVNLSANLIRDSIRRLIAEYSIPESKITFYLREDRDAE